MPVILAIMRATDASSSLAMPAAAVIRNICSAVAAIESGNFSLRPISLTISQILGEDLHRTARGIVAVENMRHPVLEHPAAAGRCGDDLVDGGKVEPSFAAKVIASQAAAM